MIQYEKSIFIKERQAQKMINFTVGPVQSGKAVKEIGSQDIPYFRTPEFSKIMNENERLFLEFLHAPAKSRAVFLTASGTGAMEAAIINSLTKDDKAIVINGGSFGKRFVELLQLHGIPYSEITLRPGEALTKKHLDSFEGERYTAFLVNACETSTGVLYDLDLISNFCRRNHLFLIVDAISAFLADELDMEKIGADMVITGSQKALACPPGVSIIALSPKALDRVGTLEPKCMYFDLKSALKNGERGQTPFTPAVGTLLQINARLHEIKKNGGAASETKRIHSLAIYFRNAIAGMPLEVVSSSLSNVVTPLRPKNGNAYQIFSLLKDEFGIWVCPNAGELKDKVFRVGHIGELSFGDYDRLVLALKELNEKGFFGE